MRQGINKNCAGLSTEILGRGWGVGGLETRQSSGRRGSTVIDKSINQSIIHLQYLGTDGLVDLAEELEDEGHALLNVVDDCLHTGVRLEQSLHLQIRLVCQCRAHIYLSTVPSRRRCESSPLSSQ